MKEFEELYSKYALPLKKYAMSLCADEYTAEDITAEAFVKAMKSIDSFDGTCKILTWLCAIAKNTYLDFCKRKKALPLHENEEFLPSLGSAEETFMKNEERRMLFRQIQRLAPENKDVVYLRIFGEFSFKEIGDILGKSENWARVTFYRSKLKMKGMMENE